MSYFTKYDEQEKKLDALLAKNELLYRFSTQSYPITLTVFPNITPDAQMAMFEQSTDGVSSQDARLVFQFFVGEIGVRVYGRLVISDELMDKIKNQAKKMRDLWLQADFAARAEQAGYAKKPTDSVEDDDEDEDEDE